MCVVLGGRQKELDRRDATKEELGTSAERALLNTQQRVWGSDSKTTTETPQHHRFNSPEPETQRL